MQTETRSRPIAMGEYNHPGVIAALTAFASENHEQFEQWIKTKRRIVDKALHIDSDGTQCDEVPATLEENLDILLGLPSANNAAVFAALAKQMAEAIFLPDGESKQMVEDVLPAATGQVFVDHVKYMKGLSDLVGDSEAKDKLAPLLKLDAGTYDKLIASMSESLRDAFDDLLLD